jgi:hypothetical protein
MTAESRRAEILRRRDTLADLREEVRDYVGMSPERRDSLIQQTARLAAQLMRERGATSRPEPMPESSRRIWRRLMEDYRRGRAAP